MLSVGLYFNVKNCYTVAGTGLPCPGPFWKVAGAILFSKLLRRAAAVTVQNNSERRTCSTYEAV
jgi:hypothetical protein